MVFLVLCRHSCYDSGHTQEFARRRFAVPCPTPYVRSHYGECVLYGCWKGACRRVWRRWRGDRGVLLQAACMVSAAASSCLSRHCPAAASGSSEGLGAPGLARDVPSVGWLGIRDGALRSKTFAYFGIRSRGSRPRCLGLRKAKASGRVDVYTQGWQVSDCRNNARKS